MTGRVRCDGHASGTCKHARNTSELAPTLLCFHSRTIRVAHCRTRPDTLKVTKITSARSGNGGKPSPRQSSESAAGDRAPPGPGRGAARDLFAHNSLVTRERPLR